MNKVYSCGIINCPVKNHKGQKKEDKNRNSGGSKQPSNRCGSCCSSVLIITLNAGSSSTSVKRHCQNGSEGKTQLYAIYKKSTLNARIHKYFKRSRVGGEAQGIDCCLTCTWPRLDSQHYKKKDGKTTKLTLIKENGNNYIISKHGRLQS